MTVPQEPSPSRHSDDGVPRLLLVVGIILLWVENCPRQTLGPARQAKTRMGAVCFRLCRQALRCWPFLQPLNAGRTSAGSIAISNRRRDTGSLRRARVRARRRWLSLYPKPTRVTIHRYPTQAIHRLHHYVYRARSSFEYLLPVARAMPPERKPRPRSLPPPASPARDHCVDAACG